MSKEKPRQSAPEEEAKELVPIRLAGVPEPFNLPWL